MKTTAVLAMFMALVCMSLPASAQNKRSNTLNELHSYLSRYGGYNTELSENSLSLRDARTGNELCRVMQKGAESITLSGDVTTLDRPSAMVVSKVMQQVSFYNFNALVGTLIYDARTGRLRMEHHLNPQFLSTEALANVATLFAASVRAESLRFSKLANENFGLYRN